MKVSINNRWYFGIYDIIKAKWSVNATDGILKLKTDSLDLTISDASKEELKKIGEMFLEASK